MKDLKRLLGDKRSLLFFDLEATQFSHEMIEIGAIRVFIRDDYSIKKEFKPYHAYVRPKHRIGSVVTKLTGINEKTLEKAISYREVLNGLKKYLGKEFGKTVFVCYGDQDPRILQATIENNLDADKETSRFIMKHCFDFLKFFSQYVRDDHNCYLSLTRACEAMEVPFEGKAHGALADAKNLMNLYSAFLKRSDLIELQYRKVLAKGGDLPAPIVTLINRLNKGETITQEIYHQIIKESLK